MATAVEVRPSWFERAIGFVAPRWALRRMRARIGAGLLARHYEAASVSRRTQGWKATSGDANAVAGPALVRLREAARDLVRNNGYAESALTTICDHVVGWGIVAKPQKPNKRAADLWRAWAETTACDSDGRNDLYGLQKLVLRTVVESGECLVRRRVRRPEDGLPIPMQLQVLDPDFIDTLKTGINLTNAQGQDVGRIVQGIEYNVLGKRVAYWLFPEHPGSLFQWGGSITGNSRRIPAESILHVYRHGRPGQARGVSWFAPVLLRFKDFDEYEDATLMKQKIAACLAVITSDVDGSASPLGTADTTQEPQLDSLEPGMIINATPGRSIEVVEPPSVTEYSDYTKTTLRAIATGLGVTYEDLTGDYADMPFSAARMSRLRHWARVEDWRWRTLIPQFCDPVWTWAMEIAGVMGLGEPPAAEWTAPPAPMIDPAAEGRAYRENIRTGLQSLFEVLRERGMDPQAVLEEYAQVNKALDKLGIVLDSDPRKTTQQGQMAAASAPTPAKTDEEDTDDKQPATPPEKKPAAKAARRK